MDFWKPAYISAAVAFILGGAVMISNWLTAVDSQPNKHLPLVSTGLLIGSAAILVGVYCVLGVVSVRLPLPGKARSTKVRISGFAPTLGRDQGTGGTCTVLRAQVLNDGGAGGFTATAAWGAPKGEQREMYHPPWPVGWIVSGDMVTELAHGERDQLVLARVLKDGTVIPVRADGSDGADHKLPLAKDDRSTLIVRVKRAGLDVAPAMAGFIFEAHDRFIVQLKQDDTALPTGQSEPGTGEELT